MNNIGQTLKSIRQTLSLTQRQMADGIMSQSNYSKVEKDEIDIPFTKMIAILNRLRMSVDEFLYIHNHYAKESKNYWKNLHQLRYNNKSELLEYKEELEKIQNLTTHEKELIAIYEAMLLIAEHNDYKGATEKVTIIWNRLEKHDDWYLHDIQLINYILFLFPPESALSISNLAITKLKKYAHLRGIKSLSTNIKMNLIIHLIQNKEYNTALNEIDLLIPLCMKRNLLMQLAMCYVRKGMLYDLLNKAGPSKWLTRGYELLDATHNNNLKKEMQDEVNYYVNT